MYKSIHCSIISNNEKLELTTGPIAVEWLVGYQRNAVLFSGSATRSLVFQTHMNAHGNHSSRKAGMLMIKYWKTQ